MNKISKISIYVLLAISCTVYIFEKYQLVIFSKTQTIHAKYKSFPSFILFILSFY